MQNLSGRWLFLTADKQIVARDDNRGPDNSTILAAPGGSVDADLVTLHKLRGVLQPPGVPRVVPVDSIGMPLVVSEDGKTAVAEHISREPGRRLRDPSLPLPIPADEVEIEEDIEDAEPDEPQVRVRRIKKTDHAEKVKAALAGAKASDPRIAEAEARPPGAPPVNPSTLKPEEADRAVDALVGKKPEAKMVGPDKVENKAVPGPAETK